MILPGKCGNNSIVNWLGFIQKPHILACMNTYSSYIFGIIFIFYCCSSTLLLLLLVPSLTRSCCVHKCSLFDSQLNSTQQTQLHQLIDSCIVSLYKICSICPSLSILVLNGIEWSRTIASCPFCKHIIYWNRVSMIAMKRNVK